MVRIALSFHLVFQLFGSLCVNQEKVQYTFAEMGQKELVLFCWENNQQKVEEFFVRISRKKAFFAFSSWG